MQPLNIKPDLTESRFRQLIAPLLAGDQASLTFETVHQHKNGTRLPVEIFLQYVAPENERPRFVAIVRDLTERKEQEAERDRIASLLHNVLNAASEVSIIATDTEGLITTFNPGSERMLGYSAEEMVGKQTPALIHKVEEVVARGKELSEEYGRPIEGFRVFVEKPEHEGAERREWTYVHKDGRQFPVSLAVTTIRNDSDEILGYVGIAEDISERKRAEAELRDQAEHTQAILDNMVDGIMTIDEFGAIDSFNPAAERIFGYQADQAVGRNVMTLLAAPCHDHGLQSSDDDQMATIKGVGREVEGQRCDGSRFPMELTVTEITRRGKRMYVGMARDISERKRIERMKSEFVSTVSHELRTPLTAISGSLGLITGGALGRLPQQAGDMIDIAHKNSQRLTYLINDLLDIEKLSAGKLQFDIQQQPLMPLVEQAIETNHSYGAKRRVALTLKQAAPGTEVRVDSQRLSQVLSNLLSNAIKYSAESGTVFVSVESRAGWSRVSVRDFGPGIPAKFRDKIFEKFAQADSSDTRTKGGTGLGLAISKQLIERMGGRIDFQSVEGQGACFFIELPNDYPTETGSDSATDSTHDVEPFHV
jgi:PAS domain S-box-containing protein